MSKKYVLYFDDTGSRDPDKTDYPDREDDMDCFGLGGFLLKEEDIPELRAKHTAFCEQWSITYPLHSRRIRGGRGKFSWLKKPENARLFFPSLDEFIFSLPLVGIAAVIDRPGYLARYKDRHEKLWYMCKTAFTILTERAARFADEHGRKLEIVHEMSGKYEDRDIRDYLKELKGTGNAFNPETSKKYDGLTSEDYRRIVLGEPHQKSKLIPMLQVADLLLYPMAKGGYDPSYVPYQELKKRGKLIDCFLEEKDIPFRGIKYYCFDPPKD